MTEKSITQNKLTSKQEVFVAAVVAGKTHRDAYLEAYPGSAKWKKIQAVDAAAYKLVQKGHIREKIDDLNSKIDRRSIATREDRMEFLTDTFQDEELSIRDRMRAVEILNRMSGDNITTNINQNITAGPLDGLSDDEIRAAIKKLQ